MTVIDAVVKRINDVMKEKGVTSYKIHKDGGIAKSTLSQILNKKQDKITLDIIYQITSTMGISLGEFFSDSVFNDITD